ncbi:CRAL-TRIO domain-containing protein [Cryomyces antarcticus]
MPTKIPPGRPGSLTPDQEAKLKEFWQATLKVFGVSHEPNGSISGTSTPSTAHTSSADLKDEGSGKKKKSRLHLFGKKHHESEGDADSPAISEDEDKYGQTKEFNKALASQTPEALRAAFWSMVKHDHPDGLLLRFLRARKWDVQNALVMLVSTMHWRSEDMHVDDDIVKRGEEGSLGDAKSSAAATRREGEDFMSQIRMGKSFLHGVDKDGRPMCFVRVRLHKQGEQSEASLERFTVYTIETARMMLRPPVDTATIVFDMTGFSMANMDYTPVKFMIKCFEANYPESLGSVLVHKSPWIFQGIWKIIKGWLDPVVASKVHFTSSNEELEAFVPRSQIIKELGGHEEWSYQYVEPKAGENAQMQDTAARQKVETERSELVRSYESATVAWIRGEGAGEKRTQLAEQLRSNYWRLDPYVRARTLYDRIGVLQAGGKLDFYPKAGATGRASTSADDLD